MAFDISDIIKKSFVKLFTDPFIFILAIIYAAAGIIFGFSISSFSLYSIRSLNLPIESLVYISVYSIIFIIFTILVEEIAFIRIYNEEKDIKKILKNTVVRFPYFIATNILTTLIVTLGLIAFIIPGIYLAFKLVFAPISSLVENKGPADALRESWELSKGNWWYLFALFLILGIIVSILSLIPYISYFFEFIIISAYPILFLKFVPRNKKEKIE